MKGVTWPRNTRQTGDEDSPEPIEENEGIDKVENPPRIEHSMLASPAPFNVDAADLYYEWKHWVIKFDLCALATELTKKDDPIQRATHLHCQGTAVQRKQNIVKNTINDLIAKHDLPATAKILTITTPRTSCIYFLPKIHKPNNPGRPSFLPTVVPLNLLLAHI